jgi:hypothetical protein
MGIFKSTPSIRIINGNEIKTSDSVVVSNPTYKTDGEYVVVVKDVDYCKLTLDSKTTDHVVVKALTDVLVIADSLIDEQFDEVELTNGSCVEFKKIGEYWYILSSDGLKNS